MQLPNKQICILNEDMYLAARNICNKSLVLGVSICETTKRSPYKAAKNLNCAFDMFQSEDGCLIQTNCKAECYQRSAFLKLFYHIKFYTQLLD